MDFLNELEPVLRMFWYIAIPASLIFLIQAVMTFVGADSTDGLEADFSGNLDDVAAPFQLFSFRNLINFLLGFSWAGIAFYSVVTNHFVLISLAVFIGIIFIGIFFLIIVQIRKLAEDNSFRIMDTIGLTCTAYTPIPAAKSGTGKVQISVRGAYHELDAITENQEPIPSGSLVRVKSVDSGTHLVVEKL